MTWLIAQCIKNEGYWLIASLLTAFLYFYDERSWRGFAVHGFRFEMQRFRTRIIPLAILNTALPLLATMQHNIIWQLFIAIGSALVFHFYQLAMHDFSGRTMSGAAKRIFLGTTLVLILSAFLPMLPTVWVPLLFVAGGTVISLSSRNHLIFKLSEDTQAIRQQLASSHADLHNSALFRFSSSHYQSSDDNTLKAG